MPVAEASAGREAVEFPGDWLTLGRGVLNAPVEARCRRSNSSCSFGGRRGGEGPVAKAPLLEDEVKKRREGRRNRDCRSPDIMLRSGSSVYRIQEDNYMSLGRDLTASDVKKACGWPRE